MKKIEIEIFPFLGNKRKPLLIMKLTFLLTVVCVLQLSATVYSQATKFSFEMRNQRIQDVLRQIEKTSDFRFFYQREQVDVERKVNLNIADKTVEEILPELFKGQEVVFDVRQDNLILIKPEKLALESSTEFYAQQQKSVLGKVTDATGSSLPGVSVVVKGTTIGTITDANGNYSLPNVPENATLQFSFVGMKAQEVAIGGKTIINVTLIEEAIGIEEVVAIGYGTLNKKELTSAVSNLRSEDLLKGAVNNPLQLIDGKVSGVFMSNTAAADPNSGPSFQIRGAASLEAGNSPLVVIDGMPGGDLRNIAQQDIESITVLKDGSSAAIYGSRAANGVILIQTKRGKTGQVSISYDGFIDHDRVAAKPDILSAEEFLQHKIDTDNGYRTNWYDELIRKNNFGQNHFIAVSGGNDNTIFRISANYRDKQAIDIASERKETGIRANFQQKAFDGRVEFNGNLSFKTAKEEYTNYGVFKQAVKLNPTYPIMDPKNPQDYYIFYGFDVYNPVQELKTREDGADQMYSIIDLNTKINILKNLNTEIKIARQDHDQFNRFYSNSKSQESFFNNRKGRAMLKDQKWNDLTFEWIGNYFIEYGKHQFKFMSGYSYQEFNEFGFWAENADFPSDAFKYNNLDEGSWNNEKGRLGMDSWKSKEKTIAFFGRANYNISDTYFFTTTLRYEGNTKFGDKHKWGLFPSLSGAWRISKLPLFNEMDLIDDLKIRLSYGETGRSGFARYSALARYQGWGKWKNDEGQWITVYGPSNNPNYDLRWEKQISYNAGIDFSLLNSRLNGSIDLFLRKGKDVISNYDVPVPPYLHDQLFTNVATTSSRGVELMSSYTVMQTNKLSYKTSIVFTYLKSKLDKFSSGTFVKGYMDRYWLPSPGNPGMAQRLEDGVEIGSFYGYKYAGVNELGQILIWKDGKPGTEKVVASSSDAKDTDRTYIGTGAPHYDLTWGNSIKYGRFDLDLYFRGRFDYKILNLYQMYYGLTAEPNVNLLKDAYTRNAHIKSGKVITDYFLENGDYFKLDNLTLGYNPNLKSKFISNMRIYANVRNVFTITKFTGLDPTTVNITGLEPGIGNLEVYPVTRTYTLGLQVTF